MKNRQTKITIRILALLLVTLIGLGCKEKSINPPAEGANNPVFNPALFKQNIMSELQLRSVDNIGYTFVINHLGLLAESAVVGYARMPQDGDVEHSIHKEMNIASVTKWLTAVGALRLLKVDDVSVDELIWTWLPKSWELGPGVKTITFRELLIHSAGLTTKDIRYATDFNSLKTCIKTGVVNNAKDYNYSNVNFALFRILFAFMDNIVVASFEEYNELTVDQDTAAFDQYLSDQYLALMQEKVFTPAEVGNAQMKPENFDDITMMYYRFNTSENGSLPRIDWTLTGGGGGYYLSPKEIASVMAHVFHSDDILNSVQVEEMEDGLLGFDSSSNTERGPAYEKSGALYRETNGQDKFNAGDHGLQTLIMKFPGDVELVFFTNALGNGWTDYVPLMVKAYEDAWVD